MKTSFIKIIAAAALFAVGTVYAQNPVPVSKFTSQSLLRSGIASVTISNTFGLTNLIYVDGTLTTNNTGLSWTNDAGTKFTVTGSAYTNINLANTAFLWAARDGTWPVNLTTNTTSAQITSPANISVTLVGGSGANTATSFVISPTYDGKYVSTATGDDFTFAVTPNTTTTVTISTNLPVHRWVGAYGITVKSITPGDTDASSQVTIKSLRVNGYPPWQ